MVFIMTKKFKLFNFYILLSLFIFTQPTSQLLAFYSFDDEDKRGKLSPESYQTKLKDGGKLTEEVVQEWLTSTFVLSSPEKQGLKVKEIFDDEGGCTAQLFSIFTCERNLFLKVWDFSKCVRTSIFENEDGDVFDDAVRAKDTYSVKKTDFAPLFQNSTDFPKLAVDEWAGFYKDLKNNRHYMNLMMYAKGISLDSYLKDANESKRLPVIEKLGTVFGNAHAKTLI